MRTRHSAHRAPGAPAGIEYAASVLPGLEEIAGQEIRVRLSNAQLVDQQRGWVVFRWEGNAARLLDLRTTEDVFVVLYRSDQFPSFRKEALPLLTRMATQSRHWEDAFSRFNSVQTRGVQRVTFRVIAQQTGQHGFRRHEARDAVLAGVQTRWGKWKQVADDAHLEVWLSIIQAWALLALRLSDRSMRHRAYKEEHLPASLRPSLAAAMVQLARPRPGDLFCDPLCGVGTILAERALAGPYQALLGGDLDERAVQAARTNLYRVDDCTVYGWDARRLPLRAASLDAVACNLPFGVKVGSHEENPALYDRVFAQLVRALKPGGRAVLLSGEKELMHSLIGRYGQLVREREVLVGVLGQAARIYVLRKR
ncbi:MAG: methyltransferase domain-containing protein [Anaerolineae bacterium]|nr:methyltransferase domain-containing protein [Anaerolineae bacterium]